jgi:hypothetical protein
MANLADPHLGRRVLEFIDAAEAAALLEHVMALFETAIGEFGFHARIMAGIPTSDVSLDKVTLANGRPAVDMERSGFRAARRHPPDSKTRICR